MTERRDSDAAATGEAADVSRMSKRILELEMAMVPFVAMAESWHEDEPDSTMMDFHEEDGAHINLGHCRRAAAAYYGYGEAA